MRFQSIFSSPSNIEVTHLPGSSSAAAADITAAEGATWRLNDVE